MDQREKEGEGPWFGEEEGPLFGEGEGPWFGEGKEVVVSFEDKEEGVLLFVEQQGKHQKKSC